MDPLRSYLGRLLLEEITPVVMVLTTPLAEAACQKSGLSFVDMLSPFSLFKKIDGDVPPNALVPMVKCYVWLVLALRSHGRFSVSARV